jgi:sortase A
VLVALWVGVVLLWGDPLTSLYTKHAQKGLAHELRVLDARWPDAQDATTVARAYRSQLEDGQPFGRIVVPRLHLDMVVVEGTGDAELRKGPGHYRMTATPGLGGTVAIAGHRTTWLHPFRHIDELRPGDDVYLEMPYGRFLYVVTGHRVVDADDWSILRRRPWEKLVLSACHPLYSASQRWVVFGRLSGFTLAPRRSSA